MNPASIRPDYIFGLASLAALLAANTLWYERFAQTPAAHPFFLVAGGLGCYGLGRLTIRVRYRDLSNETRLVAVSSVAVLCALLWLTRPYGALHETLALLPAGPYPRLQPFFYFAACCLTLRTVLPLLLGRVLFGWRPADLGYRVGGTGRLVFVYLGLLACALPFVFWAAQTPAFQRSYPQAPIVDGDVVSIEIFIVYQLAYLCVFFSGESFWRGWILFGLERQLGSRALPFMIVLYSMAHYGKPFEETTGAIFAGAILGWLALRHRSFWLGVALHWSIALAMDILTLRARGITLE